MLHVPSCGAPPELLGTHPTDANRMAKIREFLPEARTTCAGTDLYGAGAAAHSGVADNWS